MPINKPGAEMGYVSPEFMQVSDRDYGQYLEMLSLPETELSRKVILDLSSGFADFVRSTNEKYGKTGTKVLGLDPVYSLLKDKYEEFSQRSEKARLPTAFQYRPDVKDINDYDTLEEKNAEYYNRFIEEARSSGNYIAGSHQDIPLKDESVDLIVSNNGVTQHTMPREKVRRGISECLRVIKEHGEIRLRPVPLNWQKETNSFHIAMLGTMRPQDIEALKNTGKIPDEEMVGFFTELLLSGVMTYCVAEADEDGQRHAITLIIRKDNTPPVVEQFEGSQTELHLLDFSASEDSCCIPSYIIELPEKQGQAA